MRDARSYGNRSLRSLTSTIIPYEPGGVQPDAVIAVRITPVVATD